MSIFDRTFLRSASGTRFTHKIARAVVGGLLALGAASALQAATLSTLTAGPPNDGVLQNFSGIDWNANGGSWIQGFGLSGANVAGDTSDFTFTYQAFAGSIGTTSPTTNLYVSSPGPASGSYELTTYATLFETATCLNNGCSTISIALTAGLTSTWAVYFDITPDANQGAGSGFLDGVQILGGNFLSGLTTFLATGPIGPGSIGTGGGFLSGEVTYTNAAYVAPDLLGTTLQASLQFPGQSSPTYRRRHGHQLCAADRYLAELRRRRRAGTGQCDAAGHRSAGHGRVCASQRAAAGAVRCRHRCRRRRRAGLSLAARAARSAPHSERRLPPAFFRPILYGSMPVTGNGR
jgi:hypothetical protein